MRVLDAVVAAAASEAVTTPDLLRQVQTLAAHLRSAPLRSWARAELAGYLSEHRLPSYRGPFRLPVGDDDELELELRGPVAEIAELAEVAAADRPAGDEDAAVARYRRRLDEGFDARIALMRLCAETDVVPAALLRSVVESVRNRVLEVALDVRAVARESEDADSLSVSAASLAFILDGVGFGSAPGGADGSSTDAAAGLVEQRLVEQMSGLLGDAHRATEAVHIVLHDEPSADKRNSVQRLANAVRSGRIAAAPGIHPDEAADRVVAIAARHHGW